jgi:hypothetical protein
VIERGHHHSSFLARTPKIIGVFALIVWAHGLFYLWPLPPKSDALPLDLEWSLWREGLILTLVGLTVGTLAYRAIRFWWLGILLTSGTLLLLNVAPMISDIHDSPSFSHWLNVWFTVFGRLTDQGKVTDAVTYIYTLFVYPFYHFVLVTATLSYLALRLRSANRVPPAAA